MSHSPDTKQAEKAYLRRSGSLEWERAKPFAPAGHDMVAEAARLIPEAFKECRASSLTYGILDFSSYSLLSPHDRDRIRRSLEQAIALHESRLTRVRVALEPQRELDRALRFRIDALMELGELGEKVQFDAVLQLNTQTYVVR